MKKILLVGIILISTLGGAAYPVSQNLNVPGNLTVTGTTGATGKIFSPNGMNAIGGTVEADHFIGEGSGLTNLTIDYAVLSGTASKAADLVLTGQTTGDTVSFNGTRWMVLSPGALGYTWISNGPGNLPAWEGVPLIRTYSTPETILSPTIPADAFALNSNSKFYFDSLRTKYLTWDSANGWFEFNDDVYINNLYGSFIGDGSNLFAIDASNITTGVLSTQRGGLANDIGTATRGDILYFDGTYWNRLGAGTSGYFLKTGGTLADPYWSPGGGTVTQINTTGSLTGGPITSVGTLDVANGGITTTKIATGAITAANMGTNSVTQAALAAGTPNVNNFLRWNGTSLEWATAGSIIGSLETDNTSIDINMNGSMEVKNGGITADKIATGSVTSGAIALNTITAANMGTNSVTQAAIAAGSPGTNNFLRWNGSAMDWADSGTLTGSLEMDNITIGLNINGSMEVRNGGITGAKLASDININTSGVITAAVFSGSGAGITGVSATMAATANYATLSGTASKAADIVLTGQATGDIIYFDGSNWTRLAAGNAGEGLKSGGIAGAPYWQGMLFWKLSGITIETTVAGYDLKLDGGAKLILDNSFSKYLMWNQNLSRFEFNDNLYTSGSYYGSGANLSSLNASNISSGILGVALGGLGSDTSGTGIAQGSILYADGAKWVSLAPGINGQCLMTQGPGANPFWMNMGTVTSVGAGRGLTSSTNPITTTGVLTIDTLIVVTTADVQTLTNKTLNSGLIGGTTAINTTGVATFAAAGTGLFVNNNGYIAGLLAIGAVPTFDVTNPEHLKVDAGTSTSVNVISGYGDVNNYLQLNIKNRNAGNSASSDIVATADNGNENTNYVDMGINGSGYSTGSFGGPNDAYLYNMGQNLGVGTGTAGKSLIFHTGGTTMAEGRMVIDGNGLVGIGTMTPEATLTVAGNTKVTGVVTAAAFYGTFEGTYTGISQKSVAFLYPFATSEVHVRLPHNASIVSVEVYCVGGTSVVGRVDIGANNWSGTANAGTYVIATGSALPFAYTAYTDIKFTTPTVTGIVTGMTIMINYKRTP